MTASPTLPTPAPGRWGRLLLGLLATAAVLGGGTTWALTRPTPATVASGVPVAVPVLVLASAVGSGATVLWDSPLTVAASYGTLRAVTVTDPAGYPVEGELSDGTWSSTTPLFPDGGYHVAAVVADASGTARNLSLTARTSVATKVLRAVLSPRDARVVGVGLPAIVNLTRPIKDAADRKAILERLTVTTEPHVDGAWRWMNDKELHYRGPDYWTKGTQISVRADLDRLRLSDGVWGAGSPATSFTVGSAVISTVDVDAKSMTVMVDGVLVRTLKVSTGRDDFPTKGGVHLVLEKTKLKQMDSATVGIPRDDPEGYYLKVPNSVRISYGGAFVHSASWSVRDQGVRNVSHGCVNVSPADAEWFFNLVRRGDVVNIINAKAKPRLYDPGTSDWNIPFSEWAN